ncbi:type IV toxin-antitoxin system AbiEi family antitoxin [Anabaena azotica]|uniref:type IV toxin-antitoxin system AbiEi family antitoxin n=1 Tax=Anabaena azotica TaxID=197653 RepID=UPI0018F059EB|nr:type IV toxin-antitoxin system AbiEi family antitoxin [Anabaena azotica]
MTIQAEPYVSSNVLADGQLIIENAHKSVNYVCEIKTGITLDSFEQVAEYFTNLRQRLKPGQRALLVTRNLSGLVVEQLLKKNIEFIDIGGNIYLNSPEIYVFVRNEVSKQDINKSLVLTAAALQVMYALLQQPEILSLHNDYDEKIADISGVTPKTVKNTIKKLEELNYIRHKREGYEIVDYVKLLERWELGYAEELRAKLLLGTFSPIGKRNFWDVADGIRQDKNLYGYLIGGELAASIMTEYLHPISVTLHVKKNINERQILVDLKLKPDAEGSVVLLQCFGQDNKLNNNFGRWENNLAHPLLIHAELVWSGNSRLRETAQRIYDQYIIKIAQKNAHF